MPEKRTASRLFLLFAFALALLAEGNTANAYTVCGRYGQCTICDFYSERGEWRGYIEWCI